MEKQNEGKTEKRKEKKGRSETEKVMRRHHDAATHVYARETHLASQYPRHHQLLHNQTKNSHTNAAT